jgi:hypothetical protein
MNKFFPFAYVYNFVQTSIHKFWVAFYLVRFSFKSDVGKRHRDRILWRALKHDLSKYGWFESIHFAQCIYELKHLQYDSPEYKAMLAKLQPCLQKHYSRNSHHPEFYADGYDGMLLLDRIEMVADWIAAGRRNKNGNIWYSIQRNQQRFGYDDDDRKWLEGVASVMTGRKPLPSP